MRARRCEGPLRGRGDLSRIGRTLAFDRAQPRVCLGEGWIDVAGNYDWFQSETWDKSSAQIFEERIRRARGMRPQYMEIQGRTLLRAGTRGDREAGRALLRRVIAEYANAPESYLDARHAVVMSWGLLGESHRAEGEIAEALAAFAALRTLAPTVPHLRTVGLEIPYLDVLIELGDSESLDEAFVEVERLPGSLRGDGGFGSTGFGEHKSGVNA